MSSVFIDLGISADGYVAGPDQSPETPLGVGGEDLHRWMFARDLPFDDSVDPETVDDPDAKVVAETFRDVGAYVMGRQMFGGGPGPWREDEPWTGWWGPNPPFHVPVFVVTHYPREPLTVEGGTTFHFVTEGPEAALEQAREAAGDRRIRVAGGASIANQLLIAGAVDEVHLHVVPQILGGGERLFEGVTPAMLRMEIDRVLPAPTVTHVRYRVRR
ncbi:dihydrofolate reductase family protein [Patulibacter defluvii]|uniref:dihydrofolate reductase family protein n=1 Tax=Patulibacter defluvii TaxID=3095358 RepID=UPI002A752704|nr:dihydrofolate reductase family protein [Patulibacter sp. DM4]